METNRLSTLPAMKLKKKSIWHKAAKRWQLYLFILIPVVYILIFAYYPMFGVQIAFKDFTAAKGIWGSEWVGFKHFEKYFTNYMFERVIVNTLRLSIYGLLTSFPLAIIFALLINAVKDLKFKKLIQTITYIPHFISVVVLVGMLNQIFNPVIGLYGAFYRLLLGGGYPPDILGKPTAFVHMYVWSGIWQGLGWSTIIYIAALTSVDSELHEAAQIDGATRLKRIIYIDFPTILPTASIMLILNIGSIMNVGFEKTYLMQNNMNLVYSEVITTYLYKVGMTAGASNFSYASAIGLFNSVINCIMLVLFNTLSSKLNRDGASLW
jgi:putative aldouronate transport system permease protein